MVDFEKLEGFRVTGSRMWPNNFSFHSRGCLLNVLISLVIGNECIFSHTQPRISALCIANYRICTIVAYSGGVRLTTMGLGMRHHLLLQELLS